MSATPGGYRVPAMRASDADRDAVVTALSENYQAGRLTTEELEDRTGRALSARTLGELEELTVDLPGPPSTQPTPQPPRPVAARSSWLARRASVPIVAIVAAVLMAAFAVGLDHHHGWLAILIPALVIARVRGLRRRAFRSSRRD
ncbi:MAG TPA: DUF1707 domain-containing protein [Streptosporangiaceae bacterium]|nr:DUF1707 domain-containing protein [Streptosporangiaceae bacterium]